MEIVGKGKAEQIEAFEARRAELEKNQGKPVFMIAVPKDNEEKEWTACYIRKPGRTTISACVTMTTQGKILEATEVILRTEWIEGDEAILNDDDLFMSAHTTISGLIEFRLGVLKKS